MSSQMKRMEKGRELSVDAPRTFCQRASSVPSFQIYRVNRCSQHSARMMRCSRIVRSCDLRSVAVGSAHRDIYLALYYRPIALLALSNCERIRTPTVWYVSRGFLVFLRGIRAYRPSPIGRLVRSIYEFSHHIIVTSVTGSTVLRREPGA